MRRSKVDIMATGDFDTDLFEKKLTTLKDSQESIQALSSWCLERRSHHKKIVATWLQVLKKVKVEHRLTLFYLANDVIQYSKRKNFEFVESWGTTLQRATTMVRDEKVKHRILRIFKIWDQRQVYDEEFLTDLSGLLSAAPKKKPDPIPTVVTDEFQASLLISTMRSCATLEQATDARLRDLRTSNTDIDNAEELCASLKDRRHVEDAEKDVDVAIKNIENYVQALEAEIRERTQVLDLLEQADQFYETQRGEVKIVTNAYRNFGSRVKNLKKKLDELLPTLVSPIPSPDINAPSPSPDSDLDLPGDDSHSLNQPAIVDIPPPSMYGSYRQDYEPLPVPAPEQSQGNMSSDFTGNFSSFMGGNVEFDMRNIFNDRSRTPSSGMQYNDTQEAKPIEVINMRPSKSESNTDSFIISNFLKSVLPAPDNTSTNIPGLGLDNPGARMSTPPPEGYRQGSPIQQHPLTSVTSGTIGQQSTPLSNMGNCQLTHGTPLPGMRSLTGDSHTPSPYSSQNSQGNNNSVNMTFDSMGNTVNPLPPPPMPPPIFLDDENCYNKLPPKFPTWSSTNDTSKESSNWDDKVDNGDQLKVKPRWLLESGNERWESGNDVWPGARSKGDALSETPESPPLFEKAGFIDPIEYDDSQPQEPLLSSSGDVDHRVIPLPLAVENQLPQRLMKAADVDHRNLISLTGSPANHNPIDQSSAANANSLWPLTDQDYRQQMQPGDIVESVDMEMSDEEVDGKQKGGRVLVDLRSQDRDMRPLLPPPPPTHLDMDMRMIPLPSGQMPHRAPLLQTPEPHILHQNSPQFHQNQPDFRRNQLDFRQNHSDFHSNQPTFHPNSLEFRQNEGNAHGQQLNFHQNQQEFYQAQPDFHQNQQQEFEFQENRRRRPSQDFQSEIPRQPERYQSMPVDHHQQDALGFHRNDRGRGRGFRGNRRDRYGEDHNQQQRNLSQLNNRRPKHLEGQRLSLDGLPNNRPYLLKPPETVIVLDDDGRPIRKPQRVDSSDHMPTNQEHQSEDKQRMNPDFPLEQRHAPPTTMTDQRPQLGSPRVGGPLPGQGLLPTPLLPRELITPSRISEDHLSPRPPTDQVGVSNKIPNQQVRVPPTVSPIAEDNLPEISPTPEPDKDELNFEQHLAPVSHDEPVGDAEEEQDIEHPQQLSEQLEALMNFTKPTNNNSTQQSENGSLNDTQDNDAPVVKRPLLPNGPLLSHPGLSPGPLMGPNGPSMPSGGPGDLHPIVVYEYENANPGGFRPRGGGGPSGPFPPWRGGGPARGRGGFRGGPRGPWIDRGPRLGGPRDSFNLRGQKRGGQFRGAGFRGRGRGNNW